jgi:hypothetical protein
VTAFTAFPKIPRLYKDVTITEKIDGTNAGIRIVYAPNGLLETGGLTVDEYVIFAQSRTRDLPTSSPKMDQHPDDWRKRDNHGFAQWVVEHAEKLVETLGEGVHFGEWWGFGINRGYGLQKGDKRFSLFNRTRWGHFDDPDQLPNIPGIGVVPELYNGPMSLMAVDATMQALTMVGSYAAPGFMNPEGVVLFHSAGNHLYKVTYGYDSAKGAVVEAPKPQLVAAA